MQYLYFISDVEGIQFCIYSIRFSWNYKLVKQSEPSYCFTCFWLFYARSCLQSRKGSFNY